ncbi:MAG: hypothetical protein P9L90_05195 [Candidatus Aadella gelida]|nr:hypothetical protein [Candidatus Aadella gelida]
MSKVKRYFEEGYPYFITTNTDKKLPIFTDEKNCKILLVALEFFTISSELQDICVLPNAHSSSFYTSNYRRI